MKPPDPNEAPEPEYDYGDQAEGEGVIGGVVGAQPSNEIEDAPKFATAGYRKPAMAEPGCVGRSVRIPRELAGFVSGPITVKFAVGGDGKPSRFEPMTAVPDPRIANAIWQAIQSCRWVPGADPQGKPISIWIVLPVKLVSG
jgi:protein TonB